MSVLRKDRLETIEYPESDGRPMAETDVHRRLMNDLISELEWFFRDNPNVYVSGNLLLYYIEGDPTRRVSLDVFAVKGVGKGDRRIYKLWEEKRAPDVVFEISSRQTWREDLHLKHRLYEQLGVSEYFVFDPEYDYLVEPLVANRLVAGTYEPVEVVGGRVRSEVLGLELVDTGKTLRLLDPATDSYLATPDEEREMRRTLEAETARLRQEVEQLLRSKG
jgi:Uma2 family endonuclease